MSYFSEPTDDLIDEQDDKRLGLGTALLLLLLIAALLTTLVWPMLWYSPAQHSVPPTATPWFLQEA
ncbi:MAG: hypothetical protein D6768_11890 [Chloroflexi bacterium]|nr:MAG: hypothetical protein D6768_11890 [Chloroflexota bacterium]